MLPPTDTPNGECDVISSGDSAFDIALAPYRTYDSIKAVVDFVIALIVLMLTSPLVILAGLIVKLTSRGPATYHQLRLGRDGRPFAIYKLRSMYHNCEVLTGARWSTRGDPRVTPIGRVLRRTHLDELPQLWNVLRGEMSLVGPRPERPEFVKPLEEALPGYRGRLAVKPGITGLAQIQLPPDTDLDSVRDKLVLDLCYVKQYGALLDARLLLGTVLYLCGMSYAGVRRVMFLPVGDPSGVLARAMAEAS
jgi:lipopolysaccharide/colanic/teichoic acid biosynthesis glycosyltransferase